MDCETKKSDDAKPRSKWTRLSQPTKPLPASPEMRMGCSNLQRRLRKQGLDGRDRGWSTDVREKHGGKEETPSRCGGETGASGQRGDVRAGGAMATGDKRGRRDGRSREAGLQPPFRKQRTTSRAFTISHNTQPVSASNTNRDRELPGNVA